MLNMTPLTHEERTSRFWMRLRAEMRAEVDALRTSLERTQPEEATATTRARIALLRDLLGLETDRTARRPQDRAALQSTLPDSSDF